MGGRFLRSLAALGVVVCTVATATAQASTANQQALRHQDTGQCATIAGTFGQLRLATCHPADGAQDISYDAGTGRITQGKDSCLGAFDAAATEIFFWSCANPDVDPTRLRWSRSAGTFSPTVGGHRRYLCASESGGFVSLEAAVSSSCRWQLS